MLFALGHKISSKYIDLQSNTGDMGILCNFSRQAAFDAAKGRRGTARAANTASGPGGEGEPGWVGSVARRQHRRQYKTYDKMLPTPPAAQPARF